ncbi:MAG: hypothetical protein J7L23_01245 [Candidatus Diapherotrites archaeon]|nr:hypothetical protein [Candidatus Diapherotrites archaeon]
MSNTIKIAVGTDDGTHFTDEHFGSARFYLIYELNLDTLELKKVEERKNTSVEERMHGDPNKAQSVSELLKDIDALVAFAMGPNIIRIKKRFVPVISRDKNVEKSLKLLLDHIDEIKQELAKPIGIDKDIIYLG